MEHGHSFFQFRGRWAIGYALALLVLTLLAYIPAMSADFIWDDDAYVTENRHLRSLDGLVNIWTDTGATPQFYPVVHTSFWVEYQLWALWPTGYHVTNIVLHAAVSVLLFLVLRRLGVPGAWLAGAIFALHPVHAESVAWVTERKNLLSGVCYLLAMLAYLRFEPTLARPSERDADAAGSETPSRRWGFYALALLAFVAALLSKSVTATLPAVLLVIAWWRWGKLPWRVVWPTLPLFAVGITSGLITAMLEVKQVGARGAQFDLTLPERFLVAGRAAWFYATKLVAPIELSFIYPRWRIDAAAPWQWLYPIGAVLLLALTWYKRESFGRGTLAALLIFGGTLLPALGFFNVYPFRFSFVADHFQYLASAALIALFAAVVVHVCSRRPPLQGAIGAALLVLLAVLTFQRSKAFANPETLWTDTLAKNPQSFLAHNNLGALRRATGDLDAAQQHFEAAIAADPLAFEGLMNLADLHMARDEAEAALPLYERALALESGHPGVPESIGRALARLGEMQRARRYYQQAVDTYAAELERVPTSGTLNHGIGRSLLALGQLEDAAYHLEPVARAMPHDADAQYTLGLLRIMQQRTDEGRALLTASAAHTQSSAITMETCAWLLATHVDDRFRNGPEALRLAQAAIEKSAHPNARNLATLAAALAEVGQFEHAIRIADQARLRTLQDNMPQLQQDIRRQMQSYESGKPWRAEPIALGRM